jgi:hypothetical protein
MISPARCPDTAAQAIGCYLDEIAAGLTGPAGARRDILAELGAGVADAADAHRCAGLNPVQAADAAIAEFGSPERVAAGFRAELAAAQARRTAFTLMIIGPLTGALWFAAAVASHIGRLDSPWPPWEWADLPDGARLATHLAAIALAAAIGSTFFTLAVTGRLIRWLPARPAASAAIAAGSLAAVDIAMLAALAILAASGPGRLAALPLAAAGAASLARLSLAARAARDCLTLRTPYPRVGG